MSTPGLKQVYRIINQESGKAEADYIALIDEMDVVEGKRIKLFFDPVHPYIYKFVDRYEAIPMLRAIINDGQLVYPMPDLDQIRKHHKLQLEYFLAGIFA